MKRFSFTLVFILCIFFALSAKGKIDEIQPDDVTSWEADMDISGKKKGKYNVLITATDIAGNEGFFGPFNMFIDPKSDLPISMISNPAINARVAGNMNIVGTCVDDDAVAYVELRIDGAENVYRAKGKEFWSYYLNTASFQEGEHIIEAWGVDVNGVKGEVSTTTFHLDRRTPETTPKNLAVGEFVSDKISISGIVEDGNGIERLFYSIDGGTTFKEVKIKRDKKAGNWTFKAGIDTKKMEDGPQVCWFKAVDSQGSEGIYTFLFFVDNTNPVVDFIYPTKETSTSSVFSVAGRAFDTVGLKRLSYKLGKQEGDFELIPGNPYWAKEFDLTAESGKNATVEIIAEDLAGNIITAKTTVKIDKQKDIPYIELVEPLENTTIEDKLFVSGCAYDNSGVNQISYSIDNGAIETVETKFGGFGILLENITAGKHELKIYPTSITGIKGKEQKVKFTANGAPAQITFETGEKTAYISSVEGGNAIITVNSTAGLRTVYYSIDGETEVNAKVRSGANTHNIKIPVKKGSEPAIKKIKVNAVDMFDRQVVQTLVLKISDQAGGSTESGFGWAENPVNSSGKIIITDTEPLYGIYQAVDGASIVNASLGAAATGLSVEVMDTVVKLSALKDGAYSNVVLIIKDSSGAEFKTPPINVFVDVSKPTISLNLPTEPSFIKNSLVLNGSASDGAGIKSVSYILSGSDTPVKLSSNFNSTINLNSLEDGPFTVKIIAEDNVGRKATAYRMFYKDTKGPEVKMVLPAENDIVNGKILVAFISEDKFPIETGGYMSSNNTEWKPLNISSMPNAIIGDAKDPISKNMTFRFADKAGNETLYKNYAFTIDNTLDEPVVEVHLPEEGTTITKDFILSGVVYDDDGTSKIFYQIDNQPYKSMPVENNFAIPMTLSMFSDNEHTINVYAEDIYGITSKPISRKVKISLENPEAKIISPDISKTVRGTIKLTGTAKDANGIEKIEISVDNGNTYNSAIGAENWEYTLNTHIIDDGTHVIFVKAYDKYGQSSIFSSLINIDNTPPLLQFTYPLIGSKLNSNLFISGHAYDNISLEEVTARITSLDGRAVPASMKNMNISTKLLVSKDINIKSLPEGRYNLEILGIDKAENVTRISRNFEISRNIGKNGVELLYPLNGEFVSGEFNVYGRILSNKKVETATLYLDGKMIETVEVSKTNYVSFKLKPEQIHKGVHKFSIKAVLPDSGPTQSNLHEITYDPNGPWVSIDNFGMGDFAIERPYLKGRAGYEVSAEETEFTKSKEATSEQKLETKLKKLDRVEVSFDNGKTFRPAKLSKKGWKYRIETGDLADGNHFLLVRAIMDNKEVAVSRTIVRIDKVLPEITLISPGEGGRYNQSLHFSGLASDDIELSNINIALRKGDKATYGIPTFIQGLHFEVAAWGASLWNVGFGLSFFDNNVKVQLHYGQFTKKQWAKITKDIKSFRYGGNIYSMKLLANIFEFPVGFYAGPDWDWLHFTGSLGANFSLFSETQSGKPQVLSAILAQLELPRVVLSKKHKKYFRSFAFFLEGTLWFIPTDVKSINEKKKSIIKSVMPHLSGGFRFDVF
ncbi:MAG: neuraminidase [Treponema sp.]|nr:MAG: neuraminidase [Treponema sp.]